MLLFLALPAPVQAVNPDEVLDDPALETRARAMSRDLRCVVCRNQSIDDSNAGIARDMRIVLRERLLAGDTDAEVIRFMVDRYGAFILLKPPLTAATLLLWISPVLLLVLVVLGFRRFWRQPGAEDDLSDEDRALVRRLLEEEGGT